jgi:hypothetical protein
MGRFLSPDRSARPVAVPYSNLGNPQTLNLYSYVGNNPLSVVDPDGHQNTPGGTQCGQVVSIACGSPGEEAAADLKASEAQYVVQVQQAQQNVPTSKKTFTNADAAATAALDAINKQSDREGVEYGGRVVQLGKNKFKYTLAVTQGDPTGVDVDAGGAEGSRIPAGSTNAGIYHTHPSVPGHDAYRFSYDDVYHATHEGVPNYVERPDGSIMKFDYSRTSSSSMYDPNKQVILRPEQ